MTIFVIENHRPIVSTLAGALVAISATPAADCVVGASRAWATTATPGTLVSVNRAAVSSRLESPFATPKDAL